jgi:hypothetical protein
VWVNWACLPKADYGRLIRVQSILTKIHLIANHSATTSRLVFGTYWSSDIPYNANIVVPIAPCKTTKRCQKVVWSTSYNTNGNSSFSLPVMCVHTAKASYIIKDCTIVSGLGLEPKIRTCECVVYSTVSEPFRACYSKNDAKSRKTAQHSNPPSKHTQRLRATVCENIRSVVNSDYFESAETVLTHIVEKMLDVTNWQPH